MSIVYCSYYRRFLPPGPTILLHPLDPLIWLGLILVSIMIGSVFRNVEYSLDILLIFLCQPCSRDSKRKINTIICIIMICVTHISLYYSTEVTTKFIEPPREKVAETVEDFLSWGRHKIFIRSLDVIPTIIENVPYLRRFVNSTRFNFTDAF